jgi:sugar/nucleoside kinase (ribokinase family)
VSDDRLVTVLGNLSVDHVDDDPPSPGGCPAFAGVALRRFGAAGRIVTRCATGDLPLFQGVLDSLPVPWTCLPADTTSSFALRYHGDDREMTVAAVGPAWVAGDVAAAGIDSPWVHIAPLLRSDFPADTLRRLAADGHLVSYDGQGLVRTPRVGPLTLDAAFDPSLLEPIRVLKLADDEVRALTGGEFDLAAARRFGVPEILITHGSGGSDLYIEGAHTEVPATWRVSGVQATGAGDMFAVSYVAGRGQGHDPGRAATEAARFVAEQLSLRRRGDITR